MKTIADIEKSFDEKFVKVGWVEESPEDIKQFIREAIREALEEVKPFYYHDVEGNEIVYVKNFNDNVKRFMEVKE